MESSALSVAGSLLSFLDVNEQELREFPSFIDLMLRVLNHVNENGLSDSVQTELDSVAEDLERELIEYHQVHIVHDILQQMSLQSVQCDHHSTSPHSSTVDAELCAAVNECMSLAELEQMFSSEEPLIPCDGPTSDDASACLTADQPFHHCHPLLPMSRAALCPAATSLHVLQRLPSAVHARVVQLAGQVADSVATLPACRQSCTPHHNQQEPPDLACLHGDIESTAVDLTTMCSRLEKASLRHERTLQQRDTLLTEHANLLQQLLDLQLTTINEHMLTRELSRRDEQICTLKLSLKAVELKSRLTELQIKDETYPAPHTSNTSSNAVACNIAAGSHYNAVLPALRAASASLRVRHQQLQAQLVAAERQLLGYQQAGGEFQQLCRRYNQLCRQIEQKRWLLREIDTMVAPPSSSS